MCNYLYYWVTVRNSQSYWHLEHMGKTLACTRGGAGGGTRGRRGDWLDVGAGKAGSTTGSGGASVCVEGVRSGIFFDISRCYCIVFIYLFIFILFVHLLPKAVIYFSFFWFMKNNKE